MTVATPPHLPRARLPTSSPSSARLRRLAPSPVKVPPTPPLVFSPPAAQCIKLTTLGAALSELEPGHNRHSSRSFTSPPFEYQDMFDDDTGSFDIRFDEANDEVDVEFAPLELTIQSEHLTSRQAVLDHCHACRQTDSTLLKDDQGGLASFPLIFDSRGQFGRLSQNLKGVSVPDVPLDEGSHDEDSIELQSEPVERAGEVDLNPHEWFQHCVPKEVLVDFKDVFPDSSRPQSAHAHSNEPKVVNLDWNRSNNGNEVDKSVTGMEGNMSSFDSFNTFGPKDRRLSATELENDEDDSYSFSFSAYNGDDITRSRDRTSSVFSFPDRSQDPSSQSSFDNDEGQEGRCDVAEAGLDGTLRENEPEVVTPLQEEKVLPSPEIRLPEDDDPTAAPVDTPIHENDLRLEPNKAEDVMTSSMKRASQPPTIKRHSQAPTIDKALPPTPVALLSTKPTTEGAVDIHQVAPKPRNEEGQSAVILVEQALRSVDKSVTLQLWVDQEGSREVRTTFKYIRSLRAQVFREREVKALEEADQWCESPTRPEMFQQTGCWEFGMDPKQRDKWHFHHAALENLPVLRRMTVNGDEKLDYLAKGASLQIRDTGVYAVYGHEDKGRVEWKFEYLVTPRVSRSTGEYVRDEKVLVPMAFYCSPNFLNPDRAYKTNLLNVFKKQMTPNIVAEKVRGPHLGPPPPRPRQQTASLIHNSGKGSQPIPSLANTSSLSVSVSTPVVTPTSGPPIISRTFDAIAKVVRSGSSTPGLNDSPLSGGQVHKFGTKGTPATKSGSKMKTSYVETEDLLAFNPDNVGEDRVPAGSEKETPLKKGRRRAASLFSRARPFTPPSTEQHPLPPMNPLKAPPSLLGLRQPLSASSIGSRSNVSSTYGNSTSSTPGTAHSTGSTSSTPRTQSALRPSSIPPSVKTPLSANSHSSRGRSYTTTLHPHPFLTEPIIPAMPSNPMVSKIPPSHPFANHPLPNVLDCGESTVEISPNLLRSPPPPLPSQLQYNHARTVSQPHHSHGESSNGTSEKKDGDHVIRSSRPGERNGKENVCPPVLVTTTEEDLQPTQTRSEIIASDLGSRPSLRKRPSTAEPRLGST